MTSSCKSSFDSFNAIYNLKKVIDNNWIIFTSEREYFSYKKNYYNQVELNSFNDKLGHEPNPILKI